VVHAQIPVAQGGQNPDQHHRCVQFGRDSLAALPQAFEIGVHLPQRAPCKGSGGVLSSMLNTLSSGTTSGSASRSEKLD
jgi:hypothetical protein